LALKRVGQGFVVLLILGLFVVNGLLIKQNRDLKAALANTQSDFLKPGQQVRSFAAKTVSGQRQVVNYAARAKTVLLVFQPQCPACELTLPYWKAIKAACDRSQYQVFGINLDNSLATVNYLATNGLNVEVFAGLDAEFRNAYKLNLTPITIVIDNLGKVEQIWPGAFDENSKAEVVSYFGISPDEMK
jgi:peroxiredoxin